MDKIRVLLADDQDIIRTGLTIILNHQPDIEVVGQAADGLAAVEAAERLRPDVILMDIKMPRLNGIQATRQIVHAWPKTQVILLTTYDTDDWVFDGIRAGAIGYLLKDAPKESLADAVRGALRGESQIDPGMARKVLHEFQQITPYRAALPQTDDGSLRRLTDREQDILNLLSEGMTNEEIARQLSVSDGAVKKSIGAILAKLHANDRAPAALTTLKRGLADLK